MLAERRGVECRNTLFHLWDAKADSGEYESREKRNQINQREKRENYTSLCQRKEPSPRIYLVAPLCCWLLEREVCIHTHTHRYIYILYKRAPPPFPFFSLFLSYGWKKQSSALIRKSQSLAMRWRETRDSLSLSSAISMPSCSSACSTTPSTIPVDSRSSLSLAAPGCSSLLWLLVSQISPLASQFPKFARHWNNTLPYCFFCFVFQFCEFVCVPNTKNVG